MMKMLNFKKLILMPGFSFPLRHCHNRPCRWLHDFKRTVRTSIIDAFIFVLTKLEKGYSFLLKTVWTKPGSFLIFVLRRIHPYTGKELTRLVKLALFFPLLSALYVVFKLRIFFLQGFYFLLKTKQLLLKRKYVALEGNYGSAEVHYEE